jgi:hypothetical protein
MVPAVAERLVGRGLVSVVIVDYVFYFTCFDVGVLFLVAEIFW